MRVLKVYDDWNRWLNGCTSIFKQTLALTTRGTVQIRLPAFDLARLCLVGCRIRDIFCEHNAVAERIRHVCDDTLIASLANSVAGKLGGKVGVAPRIFLKKLVGELLDRVDQFEDFDPRSDYALTLSDSELSPVERQAMAVSNVDEIELDL